VAKVARIAVLVIRVNMTLDVLDSVIYELMQVFGIQAFVELQAIRLQDVNGLPSLSEKPRAHESGQVQAQLWPLRITRKLGQ
jgi:hypothetical protein